MAGADNLLGLAGTDRPIRLDGQVLPQSDIRAPAQIDAVIQ